MKDSQTCVEVGSEYTPINIAVHPENFNFDDDGKFAVPEDSDIFTPWAVSSQHSAASTVPALMNLDSMSCRQKTIAWGRVVDRVIRKLRETGALRSISHKHRKTRAKR